MIVFAFRGVASQHGEYLYVVRRGRLVPVNSVTVKMADGTLKTFTVTQSGFSC